MARDGRDSMPGDFFVVPDDRGRWTIAREPSGPAIGDRDFRSFAEALDNLRPLLASEGLAVSRTQRDGAAVRVITQRDGAAVRVITRPVYGRSYPDITLRLSTTPEVGALLEELSTGLDKTAVETIVQALVVLKIVVDAGSQGKRLAITDGDLNVEREILIPSRTHIDA